MKVLHAKLALEVHDDCSLSEALLRALIRGKTVAVETPVAAQLITKELDNGGGYKLKVEAIFKEGEVLDEPGDE